MSLTLDRDGAASVLRLSSNSEDRQRDDVGMSCNDALDFGDDAVVLGSGADECSTPRLGVNARSAIALWRNR
jgi:hypothetical protein